MKTKELIEKLRRHNAREGFVTVFSKEEVEEIIKRLEEGGELKGIIKNPHITEAETMKRLLRLVPFA